MATGTIKWFRGFGFITPDDDGKDLFVSHRASKGGLNDGARVSFDAEISPKGRKAVNVTVI